MQQVHATCVDVDGAGVLIQGPPGSGKSDLALRLMESGARLAADDRTNLDLRDGDIVASAPEEIAGKIEIRGVGVVDADTVAETTLALVVDLVAPADVERIPEPGTVALLGVSVPHIRLTAFEASAAAKVRAALRHARAH